VRNRISYQFVSKLRDEHGRLPLVQIGQGWEAQFQDNEQVDESGRRDIALPPDEFNRLAKSVKEQLDKSARQGVYAAIATTSKRRRFIRSVLNAKGVRNPVVSYEEIGTSERPAVMGVA